MQQLQQSCNSYRTRICNACIFVPQRPHATTSIVLLLPLQGTLACGSYCSSLAAVACLYLYHSVLIVLHICTTIQAAALRQVRRRRRRQQTCCRIRYAYVLLYRLLHYDKFADAADARLRRVGGDKDASDPHMHVTISFQEKVAPHALRTRCGMRYFFFF